jgi:hypothetical protein
MEGGRVTHDQIDQVIPAGPGLVHVWLAGDQSYRLTPVVAWLVVGTYEVNQVTGTSAFRGDTVEAAHLDPQRGTLDRLGVAGLHAGYVGTFPYAATADIHDAVARMWAAVTETPRQAPGDDERE